MPSPSWRAAGAGVCAVYRRLDYQAALKNSRGPTLCVAQRHRPPPMHQLFSTSASEIPDSPIGVNVCVSHSWIEQVSATLTSARRPVNSGPLRSRTLPCCC